MTATATTIDRAHPIGVAAARIDDLLKDVRDVPTWSMSPAETGEVLVELTFLQAQLAELQARVTAHGQVVEVEAASGATSTANWLAHQTRQTRAGAHRAARLATALATQVHEPVRVALADGVLLVDQAEVIIDAVDALPDDLDPDLVADAQARLIGYAAVHDAKALRILGRRILEVIAPEIGEAHEAKQLEREEAEAEAAACLPDGRGRPRQLARPVHPAHPAGRDAQEGADGLRRPPPPGLGRRPAPVPGRPSQPAAGSGVHGVHRPLPHRPPPPRRRHVRVGGGHHGPRHPARWAQGGSARHRPPDLPRPGRRLACEAGIIPAVLGTHSEVLDLGRTARFHSKAQRIALLLEQGGCTAEGCDAPPAMTHTHHHQPWSHGGNTDLKNGRLLCGHHHARAHDPTYTMTQTPGGKVRFHRRT